MMRIIHIAFLMTACFSASAQWLVFDGENYRLNLWRFDTEKMFFDRQGQLTLQIRDDQSLTRQHLEYIQRSVETTQSLHGDPKDIGTTIGDLNPMLSTLKGTKELEEDAEKAMRSDGRDPVRNPAEYNLRSRDKANVEAEAKLKEAAGLRAEYIAKLSQLTKRLKVANTDAEVSKITAEIAAVNAALNALKSEAEAQLAFSALEERKREIASKRVALIRAREDAKIQKEANQKELERRKAQLAAAVDGKEDGSAPDPTNMYSKLFNPLPSVKNVDWNNSSSEFLGFSFGGGPGPVRQGMSLEELLELQIASVRNNPNLTDAQKEKIIKRLKAAFGGGKED